jgi:hypothetical protein
MIDRIQFAHDVSAPLRANTAAAVWQNIEPHPATSRPTGRARPLDALILALLIARLNLDTSVDPQTEVVKFTAPKDAIWEHHSNNVRKFDQRKDLVELLRSLDKTQVIELAKQVSNLSARVLSNDPKIQDCFYNARSDAVRFVALLPQSIDQPSISVSEDGEIVLDWRGAAKQALVDFDGDGSFGYALLQNGRFEPGAAPGDLGESALPKDLRDYITSL